MAVYDLAQGKSGGHRLSEGTTAVNDTATLNTNLNAITGGGIFILATAPPERHVQVLSIAAPTAVEFHVTNSVGAALTVLVTVGYLFTGS